MWIQIRSTRSLFTKEASYPQSPFRVFVFVWTTMSFPQTAPIVDADFYPVTWHDQRRPFFYVLAYKTRKTRRGLAGEASSDDQVSPVFVRRGERERERSQRIMNYPLIIFILPFYIPMCYMSFLLLSSTRLHVDVLYLLWPDLTCPINTEGCSWPSLKVRRPHFVAPPWIGDEYSLTTCYTFPSCFDDTVISLLS
jgi:hypothetical protein